MSLTGGLFLFLFFSLFFSCRSPKKTEPSSQTLFTLSVEERKALKEFFRELLFEGDGAYTLFGTKPVSLILIQEPPNEEESAEWKKYYNSLSEDERKKFHVYNPRYDFRANYEKWKQIKQRFSIKQYLFGQFSLNERADNLYFVNIEMTVRTLLKYYEDFRRTLGYDFDPLQVVFEVEDKNSIFWNTISKHHALLGILLGYGQENSWFFRWQLMFEGKENPQEKFLNAIFSKFSEGNINYPDPDHFNLPIFRNYGPSSEGAELLKRYEKERSYIKALYKDQDEVDVALTWLTR